MARSGDNGRPIDQSVRCSLGSEFSAMERLPPILREAVRNSTIEFSAAEVLEYRRTMADEKIVAMIRRADRDLVGKAAFQTYGPAHPQAVHPLGYALRPNR